MQRTFDELVAEADAVSVAENENISSGSGRTEE